MTDMTVTTNDDGACCRPFDPDVVLQRRHSRHHPRRLISQGLERHGRDKDRRCASTSRSAAGAAGASSAPRRHPCTPRRLVETHDLRRHVRLRVRAEIRTLRRGRRVRRVDVLAGQLARQGCRQRDGRDRGRPARGAGRWRIVKLAGWTTPPRSRRFRFLRLDEAQIEPEPTMLPRWATSLQDGAVRQVAGVVELFKGRSTSRPCMPARSAAPCSTTATPPCPPASAVSSGTSRAPRRSDSGAQGRR
jgi:hypothetical protein